MIGINIRTAQRYIKKYNDDDEKRLPIRCNKPAAGRKGKLSVEHSRFLVKYIDEHPAAVFPDIMHHFCEAFLGLIISISALHRHGVQNCKATLKKLEKLTAARNSDRIVALRKEKVEEWKAHTWFGLLQKLCLHRRSRVQSTYPRNHGRSRRGPSAKGTIPTAKGVTITILGAISDARVIDISLRKPQAVSTSKKERLMARQLMQLMVESEPEQSIFWRIFQM
jgi:hypothetical protein